MDKNFKLLKRFNTFRFWLMFICLSIDAWGITHYYYPENVWYLISAPSCLVALIYSWWLDKKYKEFESKGL